MTLFKILTVGCLLAGFALAQARAEPRTTGGAIGCFGPGDIKAAEEANAKHDRVKMDMLGCFPIMTNIPVKRIDEKAGLWHVLLDPDGAEPMEAWARPSSFRE